MISAIACRITEILCATGNIQECDRELYQYGVFMLLSWMFFFILTVTVGVFLGIPGESILFYAVFSLLRSYAGGVHAKTEKACTLLTALTMTVCVTVIRLLKEFGRTEVPLFFLFTGAVCVFVLSPLDTEEKPLAAPERQHYRKIANIITLLSIAVALLAHYTTHNGILRGISVGVFVEGMLLILGSVKAGLTTVKNRSRHSAK